MKALMTICFSLYSVILLAQATIQGVVYDGSTQTPLPGANAFIANTTKGTSTNADGTFTIRGLQPVRYELVVSFIGYKTQVTSIVAGEPTVYIFKLVPDIQQLNEIVVRAKRIGRIKRMIWLGAFEKYFIGDGDNSLLCKLENPHVLHLDKEGEILTAVADSTLLLLNRGLGYRVKILLQTYKYDHGVKSLHYEGFMVYEPLTPINQKQKWRWAKNRLKAYYGSPMHFYRSLYSHRANEEGYYFSLGSTRRTDSVMNPRSKLFNDMRIKIPSIVNYNVLLDTVKSTQTTPILKFSTPLEVNYIHEGESVVFQKTMRVRVRKEIQTSYIKTRAPAELLPDGRTYPVSATQISGYWSWELMSESLPLDYDPAEDVKIVAAGKKSSK